MPEKKILFICTVNSDLSLMAAAFASSLAPSEMQIVCAGPTFLSDIQTTSLSTLCGTNCKGIHTLPIVDVTDMTFDLVVTLCKKTWDVFPYFKGLPAVIHWDLDLPGLDTSGSNPDTTLLTLAAGIIKERIHSLFSHGYINAFSEVKTNTDNILNSLSGGIFAHDLKRRIFYFSTKAAELTGLSPNEVMGKDCHEIFQGGLCSENCSFCDGSKIEPFDEKTYPISFSNKQGKRKECDLSVVPLKDESGKIYGVAASLKDNSELNLLKLRNREINSFRGIIGNDPQMLDVFQQIKDVAEYPFAVHISGETGTGKELVAAAIHNESPRRNKPFVPVNCGALPESLIESELFGHVKGSFSGAIKDKKGRFELAEGGTIFLDEIGELSKEMQVKLLRFLQEGTFEKVGGEKTMAANVRVISATNRNLKKEVQNNTFREDVYYRLNVIPVILPPLRNKKNDIPLLVSYFLSKIARIHQGIVPDFSEDALSVLMQYSFPGNVRELENAVQYAIVRSHGKIIMPEHLPMEFSNMIPEPLNNKRGPSKKLNHESVHEAISKAGGNKSKAARLLGVGRATLYRFLEETDGMSD
ncbi:MAG: sigma 54-interacting transcriptional regulator [Desulfobacteraceae bacterium]|jgi:PAS domain S-box-containing protein